MAIAFKDLGEREILALAVSLEEEDGRIYGEFAEGLRKNFPATARIFETMREEESEHRRRLLDQYKLRFGDHLPLIRRTDVKRIYPSQAILAWVHAQHQIGAECGRHHGTGDDAIL